MTFLTTKDVAIMLKKSEAAIRNYIKLKTIPFYKKNGSIYFIKEEIEKWIIEEKKC